MWLSRFLYDMQIQTYFFYINNDFVLTGFPCMTKPILILTSVQNIKKTVYHHILSRYNCETDHYIRDFLNNALLSTGSVL
jgi:hypothetical protein